MRLILTAILCAACASPATIPPTPAPVAVVRAAPTDAAQRVVSLFQRAAIPVVSNDGTVITTGPVDVLELSGGTGLGRVTGRVEYFIRATVSGDSTSTVTLTPWSRAIVPDKPATEQVVPAQCPGTPKCAAMHQRVAALTDSLRS